MGIPKYTGGIARLRLIERDNALMRGYGVRIEYVDGRTDMRFVGSEEKAFVTVMDELKKLKYIAAGEQVCR